MYFFDDEKHRTPHFHAKYGEYEASFDWKETLLPEISKKANKIYSCMG